MKSTKFDLEERLLDYSVSIIRLVNLFPESGAGRHVAGQLLRSGTAPLPNHGEAQAAESPDDFVHKMKLCLKELRESWPWLRLAERVPLAPTDVLAPILKETDELVRIFVASINTVKARKKS